MVLIINLTEDLEFEDESYLYWIRRPDHVDIATQGYIGISVNPQSRLNQHNSILSKKDKAVEQGYSSIFIEDFLKYDLYFEVVQCGSRNDVQRMEFELRPDVRIGYNVAIGGEVNGVCSRYKHGGTKYPVMHERFTRFLKFCEKYDIYIDPNFKTDSGFSLFLTHAEDRTLNIETKRKRIFLKDESVGFAVGNFYIDLDNDATDNSNWVFYKDRWWSKREACEFNGIKVKTADKRITKYKMSRLEAVGFESRLKRNQSVIYLGHKRCVYDKVRSGFSEEDLVAIYNFYISGETGFNDFCESKGICYSNMYRYFKRFGIKRSNSDEVLFDVTGVFN